MVMVAPASARNHANVGPAMPAPLIKTRIASFDVFESVRTLEGRMDSELEARTGLVILQLLDKEDHLYYVDRPLRNNEEGAFDKDMHSVESFSPSSSIAVKSLSGTARRDEWCHRAQQKEEHSLYKLQRPTVLA